MKRFILVPSVVLLCSVVLLFAASAEERYVQASNQLVNVYERLDPQSPILRTAKKGEYFPLVYEGASWYQVWVDDKSGWIEKRDGKIITGKPARLLSLSPINLVLIVLFLLAAVVGSIAVISRQKHKES